MTHIINTILCVCQIYIFSSPSDGFVAFTCCVILPSLMPAAFHPENYSTNRKAAPRNQNDISVGNYLNLWLSTKPKHFSVSTDNSWILGILNSHNAQLQRDVCNAYRVLFDSLIVRICSMSYSVFNLVLAFVHLFEIEIQ